MRRNRIIVMNLRIQTSVSVGESNQGNNGMKCKYAENINDNTSERHDREPIRMCPSGEDSKSLIGRRVLIELASCRCQSSNSLERCSKFSELDILDGRLNEGWSTSRRRCILWESCSFSRLRLVFYWVSCSTAVSSEPFR